MAPSTRSRASRGPPSPTPVPSSSPNQSQLQVQRPTTTAEIVVTPLHSFELMRTVVTVTMSSIIHRRKVFHRSNPYYNRPYDPSDTTCLTYDGFKQGPGPRAESYEPDSDVRDFKILARGHHPAADKILDWLELGVKDALEKKYLAKLELAFHHVDGEPVSNENIFESYAMAFTYTNDTSGVVESVIGKGTQLQHPLRSAKQDAAFLLDTVDRQMMRAIRTEFSELPSRFRITMNMSFNEKCPFEYQPDLFCASKEPNTRLLNLGPAPSAMRMGTGFHDVAVYLHEGGPSQKASKSFGAQSSPRQSEVIEEEGPDACVGAAEDNSRTISPGPDSIDCTLTQEGITQQHNISMLQNIGVSRDPEGDTQDTIFLHQASAQQPREKSEENLNRRYADMVCTRIDKAPARNSLSSQDESAVASEVKCECEVHRDELNLMKCNICGFFQHMQCYGYYEPKAKDVESVCYSCLLRDDTSTLSAMKAICTRRRVLYHLHRHGSDTVGEIAAILDSDTDTTVNILASLNDYLQEALNAKGKRSHKKIAQLHYTLVADENALRRYYFNPDIHISHYLKMSSTLSGPTLTPAPTLEARQRTPTASQPLKASKQMQRVVPLDGSSTQGTPSPLPQRRQSKIPPQTPEMSQPGQTSMALPASNLSGRKRGALHALRDDSAKRVKGSIAHSPQMVSK